MKLKDIDLKSLEINLYSDCQTLTDLLRIDWKSFDPTQYVLWDSWCLSPLKKKPTSVALDVTTIVLKSLSARISWKKPKFY